MIVAVLEMELHIPGSQSLKEKRFVLKRLKDKLHNEFRVSVAEVGDSKDTWDASTIAVAAVSDDGALLSSVMDRVVNFTGKQKGVELFRHRTRFLG